MQKYLLSLRFCFSISVVDLCAETQISYQNKLATLDGVNRQDYKDAPFSFDHPYRCQDKLLILFGCLHISWFNFLYTLTGFFQASDELCNCAISMSLSDSSRLRISQNIASLDILSKQPQDVLPPAMSKSPL